MSGEATTTPIDPAGGPPASASGRRAAVGAGLVLALAALLGELAAPARVLPVPITLLAVVAGGITLARIVATVGIDALARGRGFRVAALVVLAPMAFVAMGPRYATLDLLALLVAAPVAVVLVPAGLVGLWRRPRDAGVALLALLVLVPAAGLLAGAGPELRLRAVADRYRADAAAEMADPPPPAGWGAAGPTAEVVAAYAADERDGPPVGAGWIWLRTVGFQADPLGVVYAPDSALSEGGVLQPEVFLPAEGYAYGCEAAGVDDFYWCSFS